MIIIMALPISIVKYREGGKIYCYTPYGGNDLFPNKVAQNNNTKQCSCSNLCSTVHEV